MKGKLVRELWERLKVVNSERANNFSGTDIRPLYGRSRTVGAVRPANVVGSDVSLFLCS